MSSKLIEMKLKLKQFGFPLKLKWEYCGNERIIINNKKEIIEFENKNNISSYPEKLAQYIFKFNYYKFVKFVN